MNDEQIEHEFRMMFAERSEDALIAVSPYSAVRRRIALARRARRRRIGGAGAALAVAAIGAGVWAAVAIGPEGVAPTAPPTGNSSTAADHPLPGHFYYDDGTTELPAGPLRAAAEKYLRSHYSGDPARVTVVTTFNAAMQRAAERPQSAAKNDIALAALDPQTGYVRALRGPYDRAIKVADTFKPVILAAAFGTGLYTPDSVEPVNAENHPLRAPGGTSPLLYVDQDTGKPRNWPPEHAMFSTAGDVKMTLDSSLPYNEPFAQLALAPDVGLSSVMAEAAAMGISSDSPDFARVPALALGVNWESPLTMAEVYGVLASGGVRHDPVMVLTVRDAKGNVVWQPNTTGVPVLSKQVADEITGALHKMVDSAPGTPAHELYLNGAAGMFGTDDEGTAAWFDGYSSELVTTVAFSKAGADGKPGVMALEPHDAAVVSGQNDVRPVWADFMNAVDN